MRRGRAGEIPRDIMLLFGGGLVVIGLYVLSGCRVCGRCCSGVVAGCWFFCCWRGGRVVYVTSAGFDFGWSGGKRLFLYLYDSWPGVDVVGRRRVCFRRGRFVSSCIMPVGRGGIAAASAAPRPPTPYQKTIIQNRTNQTTMKETTEVLMFVSAARVKGKAPKAILQRMQNGRAELQPGGRARRFETQDTAKIHGENWQLLRKWRDATRGTRGELKYTLDVRGGVWLSAWRSGGVCWLHGARAHVSVAWRVRGACVCCVAFGVVHRRMVTGAVYLA